MTNLFLGRPLDDTPGDGGTGMDSINAVTNNIKNYVGIVTAVFLSICALLVLLFAIYVGFKMAKAEDDGKRTEAKKQLIYSIIGVLSIVIIVVIFQAILPLLTPNKSFWNTGADTEIPAIQQTYNAVASIVNIILQIIGTASIIFAVYVGWQLMKAEEEQKRTDAKKQLLYTVIGLVAIVLINFICQAVLGSLANRPAVETNVTGIGG